MANAPATLSFTNMSSRSELSTALISPGFGTISCVISLALWSALAASRYSLMNRSSEPRFLLMSQAFMHTAFS